MVAEAARPRTLVRIGSHEGNLEQVLKQFNPDLRPSESVFGKTNQYALYEESSPPYLLMVSQPEKGEDPGLNYNTTVTVTSEDTQRNRDVMCDFESKTGLDLREAPKRLQDYSEILSLCFPVFKRRGQEAIKIIRQIQGLALSMP